MTLSPAYDLLNTSLHIQDSDFALSGGLFRGASTHTNLNLFEEFGRQLGMQDKRIRTVIDHLMKSREEVETLVKCSFLSPPGQTSLHALLQNALQYPSMKFTCHFLAPYHEMKLVENRLQGKV